MKLFCCFAEFRADTMPALLLLGLLVATLCPAVLCHPVATAVPQDARRENTADATRLVGLVSSNADFACSLYKQLALLNQDKNIIFSPLSISTALAFLALGARDSTLTELLQGLKFNLTEMPEKEIHQGFRQLLLTLRQPQEQLQLNLGNALFVGLKLLPDFEKGAQELYAAEAFHTNFQDLDAAKKLINDHVAEKTQGKIVELFDSLDSDTVMVLVNFLLFKGECSPRGALLPLRFSGHFLFCLPLASRARRQKTKEELPVLRVQEPSTASLHCPSGLGGARACLIRSGCSVLRGEAGNSLLDPSRAGRSSHLLLLTGQ